MSRITEDALFVNSSKGLLYSNNFMTEWAKCRLLNYNKNIVGTFIGDTGSGKSWNAIRFAELVDPNFSVDNIVFTPNEFMDLLNSGTLEKGSVIIYEEPQTSISRRQWFQVANRLINYVLSTFRNLNLCLIFTVPDLSFIDSNTVKLFKLLFETLSIDQVRGVALVKPKIVVTNHLSGKTYYKYLRVVIDGDVRVMDKLYLRKANKRLLADYELKKKKFNDALNKRVQRELDGLDDALTKKDIDGVRVLTDREQEVYDLLGDGYSLEQISQQLNIDYKAAANVKYRIRKKGFDV